MPDVLGLDLGIATAGAANLTARGSLQSWTFRAEHPGDGTLDDTLARIATVTRWALQWCTTGTVLAVVEDFPYGAEHGQHHERAAVHYRVLAGLRRREIPVALCGNSTLKKWATGSGRASKGDMKRAVSALWPGHGLARASEHEIDALALAGVGAHCWCEWPGPWLGPSPSALASITWPENP